MKRVYVAQSEADAQLVANQLRAAGVDAVVKADRFAVPSIPFPSVWVEDDDLSEAEQLLADRSCETGLRGRHPREPVLITCASSSAKPRSGSGSAAAQPPSGSRR
jgi:hypothetical protein